MPFALSFSTIDTRFGLNDVLLYTELQTPVNSSFTGVVNQLFIHLYELEKIAILCGDDVVSFTNRNGGQVFYISSTV